MSELFFFKERIISRQLTIPIPIDKLDVFKHTEFLKFTKEEDTAVFIKKDSQKIEPILLNKEYQFIYNANIGLDKNTLILAAWNELEGEKIIKYNFDFNKISTEEWKLEEEIFYIYFLQNSEGVILTNENSQNQIILKSLNSEEDSHLLDCEKNIESISILENENILACITEGRFLKIWDLTTGKCQQTCKLSARCYKFLLTTANIVIGWKNHPNFWIYDLDNNNYIISDNLIKAVVVKVKKIQENQFVFVGTETGNINCYLLNSGELIWSSFLQNNWIYNLEISADNSLLIASLSDGSVYILEPISGAIQQKLLGHSDGIWNILSTSSNIITSGLDETIRVWDRQSWQCTAILAGHLHKLKKMLLTVDNQYLISYDKLGYLVAWKADWDKPL